MTAASCWVEGRAGGRGSTLEGGGGIETESGEAGAQEAVGANETKGDRLHRWGCCRLYRCGHELGLAVDTARKRDLGCLEA